MSELAQKYGCDVNDNTEAGFNSTVPLTELARRSLQYVQPSVPNEVIRYLIQLGYDIEGAASCGRTALLYAATGHSPAVIEILKSLLQHKANPHVVDEDGIGALHNALLFQGVVGRTYAYFMSHCSITAFKHNPADACEFYAMWDVKHADDCVDEGPDGKPSLNQDSEEILRCYRDGGWTVWSSDVVGHDEMDEMEEVMGEEMEEEMEDRMQYMRGWSKKYYGYNDEFLFLELIKTLRTRTRFKLLLLLQAGCNPNLIDEEDRSPSDYAKENCLWPEWTRVLKNTGYIYDEVSSSVIRAVSSFDDLTNCDL